MNGVQGSLIFYSNVFFFNFFVHFSPTGLSALLTLLSRRVEVKIPFKPLIETIGVVDVVVSVISIYLFTSDVYSIGLEAVYNGNFSFYAFQYNASLLHQYFFIDGLCYRDTI